MPNQTFVACGFDHGVSPHLGFLTPLKIPTVVANMFSLPLGIMLHADVSISHRFTGVELISTLLFQAHHR